MRVNTKHPSEFNGEYFDRYYVDGVVNAYARGVARDYARFLLSTAKLLDLTVETISDIGCGLGLWRQAFEDEGATSTYKGYDASPYLISTFGWAQCDVREAVPGDPSDLVICSSVLSYLDDADAHLAIVNLCNHTKLMLFVGVATRWDYENILSQYSDYDVFQRDASFYLSLLRKDFWHFGGGVFIRRDAPYCAHEIWLTDRG